MAKSSKGKGASSAIKQNISASKQQRGAKPKTVVTRDGFAASHRLGRGATLGGK
jgi:hypothetical protein